MARLSLSALAGSRTRTYRPGSRPSTRWTNKPRCMAGSQAMASQGIGRCIAANSTRGITRASILYKRPAAIEVRPSQASRLRRCRMICLAAGPSALAQPSRPTAGASNTSNRCGLLAGLRDASATASMTSQGTGSSRLSRFALPYQCCWVSSRAADASRCSASMRSATAGTALDDCGAPLGFATGKLSGVAHADRARPRGRPGVNPDDQAEMSSPRKPQTQPAPSARGAGPPERKGCAEIRLRAASARAPLPAAAHGPAAPGG